MKQAGFSLHDVHLHYASTSFMERSLKSALVNLFRFDGAGPRVTDIHALRGITASASAGERIGLIGHNGAGKSTFLKMVAGLYPISAGQAEVRGSVRSLFDLSLGFEPSATGRENILYRGLLLGMTPQQMKRLEPEIVEFADLGEFIDYPVKVYSAGMQVRLAFAVSTAARGDILLLDEVIGAGDEVFMAKARRRVLSLIDQSELVVLASHDLNTLRSICTRGIVLHHGELRFDGKIEQAIDHYHGLIHVN